MSETDPGGRGAWIAGAVTVGLVVAGIFAMQSIGTAEQRRLAEASAEAAARTRLYLAEAASSDQASAQAGEFPGPWLDALTDRAPVEISIALTAARADCRFAYYRMHAQNRRRARVYCSEDGESWTLWGVRWDRARPTALGPLAPEPGLEPPRRGG